MARRASLANGCLQKASQRSRPPVEAALNHLLPPTGSGSCLMANGCQHGILTGMDSSCLHTTHANQKLSCRRPLGLAWAARRITVVVTSHAIYRHRPFLFRKESCQKCIGGSLHISILIAVWALPWLPSPSLSRQLAWQLTNHTLSPPRSHEARSRVAEGMMIILLIPGGPDPTLWILMRR